MSFSIFTDTASNLPQRILKKENISAVLFEYEYKGKIISTPDCEDFDDKEYYGSIAAGERVQTSQITPQRYIDSFTPELERGNDVLFVSMSSGISGSFNSSQAAAEELKKSFPERKIFVFDTLAASLGEGFMVLHAAKLREKGRSIEETYNELFDYRSQMRQIFTVDDLMHLKRTGRVSAGGALIGTLLQIKPLLKGNNEGKIVVFSKARGRKASIEMLAKKYLETVVDHENQTLGIAHALCPEDTEYFISLIKEKMPGNILTVKYEPFTGSHVGPGALAIFYTGRSL